jgi:hypothetical protein
MTRNEARSDTGLKPIAGGDDLPAEAAPPPPQPQPGKEPPVPPAPQKALGSLQAALAAWEGKALACRQAGRAIEAFENELIPLPLQAAITGALEVATESEQIQSIFRDAQRWEVYP